MSDHFHSVREHFPSRSEHFSLVREPLHRLSERLITNKVLKSLVSVHFSMRRVCNPLKPALSAAKEAGLGEGASSEGFIASFRTRAVAEPVL